jgi:hypothetical protein
MYPQESGTPEGEDVVGAGAAGGGVDGDRLAQRPQIAGPDVAGTRNSSDGGPSGGQHPGCVAG